MATGTFQMEDLCRGVVAVPASGGNYVSWRLMGYEPSDTGFNVYRDGAQLNESPITSTTGYLDPDGNSSSTYVVRAVIGGVEGAESETAGVWSEGYLSIPTPVPEGGTTPDGVSYTYSSSDGSVGDLDGDGDYELVIKWDPSNSKDNSQSGHTGNVYLDGYQLGGAHLWRIDLGVNIRAGAHYTQFFVYDLDGDGSAEVVCKTAPGTRDGTGQLLSLGPAAADDDGADYRNSSGYILEGPEYLTVFDGETGAELATVDFEVGRGSVSDWGDNYGNRVDRFLGTIAFVESGGQPSVVMARGYYTRSTLTAWNYRDGQLTRIWTFDSDVEGNQYYGQGAHSLSVADVDADDRQEIVYGAMTVDHDGTGMCSTRQGHGDALHVTDLVPSRPGIEVFMPHESGNSVAYTMRDGATCEILWQGPSNNGSEGPGRGVAADVSPSSSGGEAWVNSSDLFDAADGSDAGGRPGSTNFLVWWDSDLSRELLDSNRVRQYDGSGDTLTADGCSSNNGTKSNPTLSGDLIGDWREEVVFRCGDSIRIYTPSEPATNRIYTLMHDPQYRVAISWQNVAYNQPPHPSFHIGEGMATPPMPSVHVR